MNELLSSTSAVAGDICKILDTLGREECERLMLTYRILAMNCDQLGVGRDMNLALVLAAHQIAEYLVAKDSQ
jgi:hypothetical protein